MKNLTIENITRACRGTYHGSDSLLSREAPTWSSTAGKPARRMCL